MHRPKRTFAFELKQQFEAEQAKRLAAEKRLADLEAAEARRAAELAAAMSARDAAVQDLMRAQADRAAMEAVVAADRETRVGYDTRLREAEADRVARAAAEERSAALERERASWETRTPVAAPVVQRAPAKIDVDVLRDGAGQILKLVLNPIKGD